MEDTMASKIADLALCGELNGNDFMALSAQAMIKDASPREGK